MRKQNVLSSPDRDWGQRSRFSRSSQNTLPSQPLFWFGRRPPPPPSIFSLQPSPRPIPPLPALEIKDNPSRPISTALPGSCFLEGGDGFLRALTLLSASTEGSSFPFPRGRVSKLSPEHSQHRLRCHTWRSTLRCHIPV